MSNLYKLSQDVNDDYDTYDSCVVVADSEQEAQQIHPNDTHRSNALNWSDLHDSWASKPEQVTVELIGVAANYLKPGTVICASFHAG